jgi:hypothetical protein
MFSIFVRFFLDLVVHSFIYCFLVPVLSASKKPAKKLALTSLTNGGRSVGGNW